MNSTKNERPGVLLGFGITIGYWTMLILAFSKGVFETPPTNWGYAWLGFANTWLSISIAVTNRFAHLSWYFRMWIALSHISASPRRDPHILGPIGALMAIGWFLFALWHLI